MKRSRDRWKDRVKETHYFIPINGMSCQEVKMLPHNIKRNNKSKVVLVVCDNRERIEV